MKPFLLLSVIALFAFETNHSVAQKGIIMIQNDGAWTYADLSGTPIIEGNEDWRIYTFDPKGVGLVNHNGYKLIDAQGNWVPTEPDEFEVDMDFFSIATNFSEGLLKIMIDDKWGMLDHTGKIAVEPKFDEILAFYSGHSIAKLGNEILIVDRDGSTKPLQNEDILNYKHFQEGLAPVITNERLWGYMQPDGMMAIGPKFLSVGYFNGGLAWAKADNNLVGFIDQSGNWVIDPILEAARDFDPESGLAMVKHDKEWKYIDESGEFHQFDVGKKLYVFSDGMSIVKKGKLMGFINNKGEMVIEPKFSAVRDFVNGFAGAEMDKKWGLIDKSGEWVLEPSFDSIKDVVLLE